MALTLIATAGSVNANTYCARADANTFFEGRLYTIIWEDADNIDKDKALVMATALFDQGMDWDGLQAASTQALMFPRQGVLDTEGNVLATDSIPTFLENATAEFAKWLLASDRTVENDLMGFKRMKIGPMDMSADKYDRKPIIPNLVYQMVMDYGVKKSGPARRLVRTRGAQGASDILIRNIAEDGRVL